MLNEPDLLDGHGTDQAKTYSIHVGGKSWQLLPDEILDFCWNGGLDTPCFLCYEKFDIAVAPPVRTVRIYRTSGADLAIERNAPSLEILNSHLECMRKRGVKFFPISHVWHGPVADAYASRVSNLGAARIIYDQPLDILLSLSATQRFDVDLQIWHDYISIPQWQDQFRGTSILPQIFKIFQLGETALLHMDQELCFDALENGDQTEISKLFNARWFTRLWPIVELNMCEDAFIMNHDNEISSRPLRALIRARKTSPNSSTKIPSWIPSKIPSTCLGHVYDILARQGSRSYRDRFIAACAILEPEEYPMLLPQLPADTKDACLWLSKRRLERGDISPLLLRPSAGADTHEKKDGVKAMWLSGFEAMEAGIWGLGPQTRPSTVMPKVIGHVVKMDLNLVGKIVRIKDKCQEDYDVHCQTCNTIITCSIEFWKEPIDSAQLYHIPGLGYRGTGIDCIGMAVEEDRVLGRSRHATPSCDCKTVVSVQLT